MDRLGIIHDIDLGLDLITTAARRYGELAPEHKEGRVHRIINGVQGIRATRDVIEQELRLEVEARRNGQQPQGGATPDV